MPPPRRSRPQGRRPPPQRRQPRQEARPARSEPSARPRNAERRPRTQERRPRRQRSDLTSRVLVAVPAAILAIVCVDVGGLAWALLMIVIGVACLRELYRLLHRWHPMPAVGFAALIGMVIAGRYGTLRDVVEVAVAAVPVLMLVVLARGQDRGATVSIAGTLLGIFWVAFAFAHAELLREVHHGNGILIDIMLGTFLGDTAAYLGGRLFGRRLLAPQISPHKTVEGLFCGMLIAVLAVFFAGLYQTWLTQSDALLLGVAVAVLGPLGDLFESVIKRDAGSKDAGRVFGAHGGALDRLDAIMFTVVAGYYIWIAVMH